MKSKALIIALAFTIVLAGVFTVEAMHFGKHPGSSGIMGPGLLGMKTLIELNLTDFQEYRILNIIEKYETDRQSAVNRLRAARKNLRTALQAAEFNEDKIRAAYRQAAPIREELLVMRARFMVELKSLLTPEQWQLLEERKAKRIERLQGRLAPWLDNHRE